MPTNTTLLDIIEHVAASSEPLSDLARRHIATAAAATKNHQGDRILTMLARRADIDAETRSLLEQSTRAAVKAAWLSRTDHAPGYVEAAIAKEKRVTILATVAAHPDASPSLLTALAKCPSTKVATEILKREDSPAEAKVSAVTFLAGNGKSLNYAQAYLLRQVSEQQPEVIREAITQLPTASWWVLDNLNDALPGSHLDAYAKLVLSQWQKDLNPAHVNQWSRTVSGTYPRALTILLGHADWDTGSDLDRELSFVAVRLQELGIRLPQAVEECRIRHFGTDAEKKELTRKEAETKSLLESARTTTDHVEIQRLLELNRADVSAVLADNPALTLDDLLNAESANNWHSTPRGGILHALEERHENPVELAAAWTVLTRVSFQNLPQSLRSRLSDDDLPEVGRLAAEYLQAIETRANAQGSTYAASTYWVLASKLDDERVFEGAIPQMTVTDLSELLNRTYYDNAKQIAANALTKLLSSELTTDQAWNTFLALADQSEGSITEAMAVARLL